MSAGFKIAGEVFWGTNGAVEAYVEVLATLAAEYLGADDSLAVFLQDERDGFSMGKIVVLDGWLRDAPACERFLRLLDGATERLLGEGAFTQYGQQWVASVMGELCARIAGGAR